MQVMQVMQVMQFMQVMQVIQATNLHTKLSHMHCLGLPHWHYQLVLTWYLHQPESHHLSLQQRLVSEREPDP